MDVLQDVIAWFGSSEQWSGSNGIPVRIWEHLELSIPPLIIALVIALPIGLYIGHTRRFEFVITLAGLARALPSFGILAFFFPLFLNAGLGLGFWAAVVALAFLAIPPIVTNTYIGIKEVDGDALEAARGMGMSDREILRKVEIPLAGPLIVTGIRTSAVQVVATATLAAVVATGGLGRYIVDGFAIISTPKGKTLVFGGAILVALLAIITELAFGVLERYVRPKTTHEPQRGRPFSRIGQVPRPAEFGPL